MVEKTPFNLDAALTALKRDEHAARLVVSENLRTRVLVDAAEVVAERASAVAPSPRNPIEKISQGSIRTVGFRVFDLFDAWSGAAVAAIVLCLVLGLGVGLGAGPEVMSRMGLDDTMVAFAGDQGDGLYQSEDVL